MSFSSNIQILARQTLDIIADTLEDHPDIDMDYDEKSLSLMIKNTGNFLLNYHGLTKQLWLSSPLSGAHHFEYQDSTWKSTRGKISLKDLLQNELTSCLARKIELPMV